MDNLYNYNTQNICWINAKEIKINHSFIEEKRLPSFKSIYDVIDFLENKNDIDNHLILFCYKVIYCFKDIKKSHNFNTNLNNYYTNLVNIVKSWANLSSNQTDVYDIHKKDMYNNILLPIKESVYCESIPSIQSNYNNMVAKIKNLTDGILFEYETIKFITNEIEYLILIDKWKRVCELLLEIINRFSKKMTLLGVYKFNYAIEELKYFVNTLINVCNIKDYEYIEKLIKSFPIKNL